ncbi:hypothetical protein, partial [Microseira wollei]|uniref:hypothetical protein n=1 Tax=Microseira wollei TaxID=467598 RepID=UPI001CFE76C1
SGGVVVPDGQDAHGTRVIFSGGVVVPDGQDAHGTRVIFSGGVGVSPAPQFATKEFCQKSNKQPKNLFHCLSFLY